MFQIFKVLKSELFYSVLFCHQLYQHQQSRLGRTCNYLLSIAFETKKFSLASLASFPKGGAFSSDTILLKTSPFGRGGRAPARTERVPGYSLLCTAAAPPMISVISWVMEP